MSLQRIIVADAAQRAIQLEALASPIGGHCALVNAALQIRVQITFTRFWQERLVSLEEPEAPLVRDFLLKTPFILQSMRRVEHEALPATNPALLEQAQSLFDISSAMLSRKLASLSNGQLRRLLVARAFMEGPRTLILDDPLSGLDPAHRQAMEQAIENISHSSLNVIMGLPEEEGLGIPALDFRLRGNDMSSRDGKMANAPRGEELVSLDGINVRFGESVILENYNWAIYAGEHWLLQGANGSGKSSLLTFLTADHPQIYRNRVRLFGQMPGQGLSVWEHKRQIGFCSPELHHQWSEGGTLFSIVASGYLNPREGARPFLWEERSAVMDLLQSLGLDANQDFSEVAYPVQRLVLVMRALIRKPRLLILDEPDQGLDSHFRQKLWDLLDQRLALSDTTLVLASHHGEHHPQAIAHFMTLWS
jgi:molybdate transport system ATP-binding protein